MNKQQRKELNEQLDKNLRLKYDRLEELLDGLNACLVDDADPDDKISEVAALEALPGLVTDMEDARDEVDAQRSDEADKYDDMSENFQNGEKGEKLMEIIEYLESATQALDGAIENLTQAQVKSDVKDPVGRIENLEGYISNARDSLEEAINYIDDAISV